MKKTRFTEEQMVTILREADQRPVPEVAKKNGVNAQTLYAWRKHFGTLEPADVKRLRQLEQENGRLKKNGGRSRSGDRRAQGDHPKKVDRDAPALAAMRRLAAQYPRYGYRRIRIFLKREGHTMSTDRTHRLWRQARLQVPRRRPRRRVALSRPRPVPATAVNHVWAYDFV